MILIYRNNEFLGDELAAAQMVAILNDFGIEACWWHDNPEFRALVDVPLWDGSEMKSWLFHYEPALKWDGRSILRKALDNFSADFILPPIPISRTSVPIRYQDDPSIIGTDVVICSEVSIHSKYREYPRMNEVKQLLNEKGVRWRDLSEDKIRGNAVLNWVKKSKVYLGLETGVSHYVAGVVNKGLILQSGYSNYYFWGTTYPYEALFVPVECRNCFLRTGCPNDHKRMMLIEPREVVDKICAYL